MSFNESSNTISTCFNGVEKTTKCVGNEVWLLQSEGDYCNISSEINTTCSLPCQNNGTCNCPTEFNCPCECPEANSGIDCSLEHYDQVASFWDFGIYSKQNSNFSNQIFDLFGNNNLKVVGSILLIPSPLGQRKGIEFSSRFQVGYLESINAIDCRWDCTICLYFKLNNGILGYHALLSWHDSLQVIVKQKQYSFSLVIFGEEVSINTNSTSHWNFLQISINSNISVSLNGTEISSVESPKVVSGQFRVGYAELPEPLPSDLSISCLAIYIGNATLSKSLAMYHTRNCLNWTENKTCNETTILSNHDLIVSRRSAVSLKLYCSRHGTVFSNNFSSISVTCSSSYLDMMTNCFLKYEWNLTGIENLQCLNVGTCYPKCLNNGTCVQGICLCHDKFIGVDCSIPKEIFPCVESLIYLLPLTTKHIDRNGSLIDIWTNKTVAVLNRNNIVQAVPTGFSWEQELISPASFVSELPFPDLVGTRSFIISAYIQIGNLQVLLQSQPFISFLDRFGNQLELSMSWKPIPSNSSFMSILLPRNITKSFFISIVFNSGNFSSIFYSDSLTEIEEVANSYPFKVADFSDSIITIGQNFQNQYFDGAIGCLTLYNGTFFYSEVIKILSKACKYVLGDENSPGPVYNDSFCRLDQPSEIEMYCNGIPNITNALLLSNESTNQQESIANSTRLTFACLNNSNGTFEVVCTNGQWNIPIRNCSALDNSYVGKSENNVTSMFNETTVPAFNLAAMTEQEIIQLLEQAKLMQTPPSKMEVLINNILDQVSNNWIKRMTHLRKNGDFCSNVTTNNAKLLRIETGNLTMKPNVLKMLRIASDLLANNLDGPLFEFISDRFTLVRAKVEPTGYELPGIFKIRFSNHSNSYKTLIVKKTKY